MMKRMVALFLTAALVMTALTGCAGRNQVVNYEVNNREVTTLTFFGNKYEPENVAVIEEIISSFMEENPGIRVSYESIKGNEYYEALEKRMAAGKGDDVFIVNHDILLDMEKKGQVADLSGLSTIGQYTDRMRSQMEENGAVYWLPTSVSAFGLYCNLDLLKKHGRTVPGNLSEWKETCGYFLEQGITPVIANNDISLKTLAIGRGFYEVYQENRQAEVFGRLNSGDAVLSEYLEGGFAVVKALIDEEYVDREKALATKKTSDDLVEFIKGESPFMLTGAWAAGRVKSKNPDFSFEVVPLPILDDGSMLVINADTRLSVNADSAHPEAAMKFVEYFTQAENIRKFTDQQSSFSPLKEGSPSSVKEIQPLIEDYQAGRTVIGTDGLLDLPIWNLTEEVSKQLLEGKTLRDAMEWLDRQEVGGEQSDETKK